VIRRFRLLFEIELVDGIRTRAVRQTREKARHRKPQIARVIRFAQSSPGGVFRVLEDLGEIARIGELLPRIHLHQFRRCAADERRVRGGRDLREFAEHLDVGRTMVEVIVAHEASERLAAELAVFLLIDLLEEGTLVQPMPLWRLSVRATSVFAAGKTLIFSSSSVSVLLTR